MTLYEEPDRCAVARIKAAMEKAISVSRRPRSDAIESELKHALKKDLLVHRFSVWKSARLVAAYELAAALGTLDTFNRLWTELERRGGFKVARLELPMVIREATKT